MQVTTESRAFGGLIRRLRGGQTQQEFARLLKFSRSAVGNAETGRLPGESFVTALVELFPESEKEIRAIHKKAADTSRHEAGSARVSGSASVLLRRIGSLRRQGRNQEARATLLRAVAVTKDPNERVAVWRELGEAHYALSEEAEGEAAFQSAIVDADRADLHREANELRNLLASRLVRADRFDEALVVVDEGLLVALRDPILWRRRGVVLWYAHRYPEAYAALTTALNCGLARRRVIHARGQVLAEWGHYAAAIDELSEAIEQAPTFVAEAYARNARAFAYGSIGDMERALEEFAMAEKVTPGNGWLHYFRARCYDRNGDARRATEGYRRALACQSPALNSGKRQDALNRLENYEQSQYKGKHPKTPRRARHGL